LSSQEPQISYKLEGVVPNVADAADEKNTGVDWHPSGTLFAVPTKTFEIAIYSRDNWQEQSRLSLGSGGHDNAITDIKWSPNGRYIASTGLDNKLILWDVTAREPAATHRIEGASAIAWHPNANTLSVTTKHGALFTVRAAVPQDLPLPFGRDISSVGPTAGETNGNNNGPAKVNNISPSKRKELEDEIDRELGLDGDAWLEDDDGAGYAEPGPDEYVDHRGSVVKKPRIDDVVELQAPFQTGSTPWRGSKRYLCVNSLGYIWAVDQEDHNSVTVSFFNRGFHREYHFADTNKYDLAALAEEACLFGNSDMGKILLRFHDGFGDNWEYTLQNDKVRSLALSSTMVVVCTQKGYVRVFNLYGTPLKVFRDSSDHIVTCATHENLLMTVRSRRDGSLCYTLEDTATEQVFQRGDAMDVGHSEELTALFFSDDGDPFMFDTSGVLSVLLHWRDPLQARWIPVLDVAEMDEDANTKLKGANLWPIGVLDRKLEAIVVRGGDKYPPIPLPITSEFDLCVPGHNAASKLEQSFLTKGVLLSLHKDRDNEHPQLPEMQLENDKLVLHMLQGAAKDSRFNKCLGLVRLLRHSQALEAARKIALRFDMTLLADKINNFITDSK
jgi:chromosome transmission fidelity protein 4